MVKIYGGCYCGNITYAAELADSPRSYTTRTCDCDFCTAHGASYVSDSKGKLALEIKSEKETSRFRQGSGIVDFLICRNCGVVVGACYEEGGILYGAINSKSVRKKLAFGESISVSPKKLNDSEKVKRWKEIWFPNVRLTHRDA
ncbi:MAG: aldehyde-activating protein [Gammaproteobacteria bacterium]|nr:aldehyde-activating protein [Gammaproteobacteria bacterium]